MINKYAEINNIAKSYNACKGILRVKQAELVGDQVRGAIGNGVSSILLPGSSQLANIVGETHGVLDSNDELEDIEKGDKSPILSYIPGVTGYRNARRLAVLEKKLSKKNKKRKALSEVLGPYTSMLLAAGTGAGVGGLLKAKDSNARAANSLKGALIGGGIGALGNVLGTIGGTVSPGRSEEDQEEYYNKSSLPNWLIPGIADFNKAKGLGLSSRMIKDLKEKRKKK